MKLTVKRFAKNNEATIGIHYIHGLFLCFTVEDEKRYRIVIGSTRVPEGVYNIGLRAEGGFHNRYSERYKDIHKGMLCVYNAPNWKIINAGMEFQYILIHVGNTHKDTEGCLLVNDAVSGKTFSGTGSVDAYRAMYPKVLAAIEEGCEVTIEYIDIEFGKL
jgi:hypothetical protein